ncbi:polynucleotide adenylyltransferase PcnB [Treponema brennaborense]|uniref:Poly(A) polymerase n=1 Tax=Treponema brennaborense (strain DSM 12168 / CIP 105900 / DD5/3) TaxID=906968 RepID=F4LN47_TREBD|nr:polynucleotide adenylyltransferase PcnB [Treponema brennaborense]AEE16812.1 poly(A) polymerase [Treponema brennaborense DSM 12168]
MLIRYTADAKGKPVKKAVIYTKEEHSIPREKIDADALRVISMLREYGFDAYVVGGAVRDLLVDKDPKDFDIVTDAPPPRIKKIFRNSRIIGRRFRLVHVFFGPKIFEVSTFRSITDGSVGNSFGSMDEDVQRRDFTLNALYYDPVREQIVDYVGGVKDIRKGVIRPVIPIERIFEEDPVRMLRAVKYAATTGCKLPGYLKRKIRKSAHLLSPVSPSRLTEELMKIINSGHAYDIVKFSLEVDLYMYLQPAATAMMYADPKYEHDYFVHLKELDALHVVDPSARLGQKLAYLIYDFTAGLTDWTEEAESRSAAGELYMKTWAQCRNFVLPMNPQRTELEFAIRTVLKKLGISVHIPKKVFGSGSTRTLNESGTGKNGNAAGSAKRRRKRHAPAKDTAAVPSKDAAAAPAVFSRPCETVSESPKSAVL